MADAKAPAARDVKKRIKAVAHATTFLALAMVALVWVAIEANLATERFTARAGASQQAGNLSRLFEEQIRRSLVEIDKTLLLARQAYEEDGPEFDLRTWVRNQRTLHDLTFQISLVGPDGILKATNAGPPETRIDLSDREHFAVHVGERPDKLFVSKPVLGRASGRWSIQLTRRIRDNDGRFNGVIVGSFDPYRLARFYGSIELGPGGAISVIGPDRIVRSQAGSNIDPIGSEYWDATLFDALGRAPTGSYVSPARGGEPSRLTAYRSMDDVPLVITVGIAEPEIERTSIAKASWYRSAGAGLTVALLSFAALSVRHRIRLQQTYEELSASKEESRRKSRELEVTLDHMDQGIMMVDANGETAVINGRAVELLGLPSQFLRSRRAFGDIISHVQKAGEFDPELVSSEVRALIEASDLKDVTLHERTRPNGTIIAARTTPLASGGFVRTFSDVTTRRQAEQASQEAKERLEEAFRVRSVFVASVSHELRTPLNGIMGMSATLRDTALTTDQSHCLDVIESCSAALLDTVNDVLDFSKLETGEVETDPTPTRLGQAVAEVVAMASPRAALKDLRIGFEVDADVPPVLVLDNARFRQVLLNLVSNAVKFTPTGKVDIRCSFRPQDERGGTLHVQVRDTGIGIPAGKQDRLFREFTQVDASVRRRFGGTGLGLAICKRVVEAQRGRIGFDSHEGVGSTFWFELPVGIGRTEDVAESAARDLTAPSRRLNCLVVEDNPVNQEVASLLLRKLGHAVTIASDGIEAVRRCQETRYDVVLMDVQMPEMDGLEATARIRALGGWAGTQPIFGLTASVFDSERQACLDAGMDAVLPKPLDPAVLRSVLASCEAGGDAGAAAPAGQQAKLARELGADTVRALLAGFWADALPRLRQLEEALRQDNAASVRSLVHALVGAAENLGVDEVIDALRPTDGKISAANVNVLIARASLQRQDAASSSENLTQAA